MPTDIDLEPKYKNRLTFDHFFKPKYFDAKLWFSVDCSSLNLIYKKFMFSWATVEWFLHVTLLLTRVGSVSHLPLASIGCGA